MIFDLPPSTVSKHHDTSDEFCVRGLGFRMAQVLTWHPNRSSISSTLRLRLCSGPLHPLQARHGAPMDGSTEAPVVTRMEADGLGQWLLDSLLSVSIPAAAQGSAALEGLREATLRAAARITEMAGGMLDDLRDDPRIKAGKGKAEHLVAQWRWSGRGLGSQARFPLSTEVDERLIMVCVLAVVEYLASSHTVDSSGESRFSLLFPPTTLLLTAANLAVFFKPGGVLLHKVCLSPFCVVEKEEYGRLFVSSFVHVDAAHLLLNLAVAVPECAELERQVGSSRMAVELAVLTALSHGLYVGWAVFEKRALSKSASYYSVGAVGLSSVALAVQVTCRASSVDSARMAFVPILIPRKYMWALNVLVSHVSSPDSSLAGHMCGVLAGLLHSYVLLPALGALSRLGGGGGGGGGGEPGRGRGQGQNWGSGTWGAGGGATAGGTGGAAGQQVGGGRRRWWRSGAWHHLKELGLQVALVAVVLGVCTAANSKRPNRRPISLWPMSKSDG